MNIVSAKAIINLDKQIYEVGNNINGTIDVKGGILKNKVKRYDIDLIGTDKNSLKEETINSHTVLFDYSNLPSKSVSIPFSFYLPESIKNYINSSQYKLMIRIVLENSKSIIQYLPIIINNEKIITFLDDVEKSI
ncbi:sporulation-control protein spo0M [Neobacillus cucumis]|nr:hypothetical protein [Neobacillus cucumis]MBM7656078.1 sporulation-control protein spo0M [Neobacillus cucumis]